MSNSDIDRLVQTGSSVTLPSRWGRASESASPLGRTGLHERLAELGRRLQYIRQIAGVDRACRKTSGCLLEERCYIREHKCCQANRPSWALKQGDLAESQEVAVPKRERLSGNVSNWTYSRLAMLAHICRRLLRCALRSE